MKLLFTDVVMPDVNGKKLADEAVRRRPGLKVMFTTGYTANAVVHGGVLDTGVNFISKPFTLDQLAAKVRAVLDEVTGEAIRRAPPIGVRRRPPRSPAPSRKIFCSMSRSIGFCRTGTPLNRLSTLSAS